MSYYEGLPIYKAATDVVVRVDAVVRGFPRYHKYVLGSRLREAALELALLVARCNRREDRARLLPELCARVEDLKLLVNLGKEVQAFQSFPQFAQVMEAVLNLARQSEGWRKSLSREARPEPGRQGKDPRPRSGAP